MYTFNDFRYLLLGMLFLPCLAYADWANITLDDTGSFSGGDASIVIGSDGLPVISYYHSGLGDLRVLHCGDGTCSSGNTITTVDSTGDVGNYNSIVIGNDGFPNIAYNDVTNFDIKYVHCGDVTCSSGNTITTVESTGKRGFYADIAIGGNGLPVITNYVINTDLTSELDLITCLNASCSFGLAARLDGLGIDVGIDSSLMIGSDGYPIVSYLDNDNANLKVAHCTASNCSSKTVSTLDSTGDVGYKTDIAQGDDGYPVISYGAQVNNEIKVLHCGNAACSSGNTISSIDTGGSNTTNAETSIAIGNNGNPIVSYIDEANGLVKVAVCGNPACSSGNEITTIDNSGHQMYYTAIVVGDDGNALVAYIDHTTNELRLAYQYTAATSSARANHVANLQRIRKLQMMPTYTDRNPPSLIDVGIFIPAATALHASAPVTKLTMEERQQLVVQDIQRRRKALWEEKQKNSAHNRVRVRTTIEPALHRTHRLALAGVSPLQERVCNRALRTFGSQKIPSTVNANFLREYGFQCR